MELPLRGEFNHVPFGGRRLLERALVVVRFSPVLRISDESGSGIADFQDDIRATYPLVELEYESIMRMELRPDGAISGEPERHPVWRIFDVEKEWRVSLTPRSIALEVGGSTYTNWPDFGQRIADLIAAAGRHFAPSHRQYVGVRYVNSAPIGSDDPRDHCTHELVSITGNAELEVADLLWRFRVDEGHLTLRSGLMPAQGTYDPNVYNPRDHEAWYLDIDVANDDMTEFDSDQINSSIYSQVRRVHAIYSWALQGEAKKAI